MSEHQAGAGSGPAPAFVRLAVLADVRDAAAVSRMLAEYLVATEREKGSRLVEASSLPERYQREVLLPEHELSRCRVLLALMHDAPVGLVVLTPSEDGQAELKRLWTAPEARSRGVAAALLGRAIEISAHRGDRALQLSVWGWRESARRLYERHGFTEVDSWESRPELVCMRLALEASRWGRRP